MLVAVGSPDRVFVADAVVASGYHRFDDEASRFPRSLSYDSGLTLTDVRIWPDALSIMEVWPKTAAAGSNPGALWFGTLTELDHADAAMITGPGRSGQQPGRADEDDGLVDRANTPLSSRERDEIRGRLTEGESSAEVANRLQIPVMRVAAIKAHMTMGTYDPPDASISPGGTNTHRSPPGDALNAAATRHSPPSTAARRYPVGIADGPQVPISVGIDVAEARKGLDLVALNSDRSIAAAERRLTVEEAVSAVLSLRPLVVCVDSPSGWSTSGKSRDAERQLARIGIHAYSTPLDPADHPFYAWIRVGMEIYQQLATEYPEYRGGELGGHAAEIFPHASAALLAGSLPARGEKEPFRRQVLRDHGVAEAALPTLDLVDAALAALTGLIALDGRHSTVGDPTEGVILLPVRTLPLTPLVKGGTSTVGPANQISAQPRSDKKGASVQLDYVNRNGQTVMAATGLPGTDHGQYIYVLRCGDCEYEYGSNGSDNFQRKCPSCQGGKPGLSYSLAERPET